MRADICFIWVFVVLSLQFFGALKIKIIVMIKVNLYQPFMYFIFFKRLPLQRGWGYPLI